MYRIVTESGLVIKDELNKRGAESWWDDFDGVYEFDDGHKEYIYIEEV